MNTSILLFLSAILVITSGVSLAIFMNAWGPSNVHTATNQGHTQVVQDNDNRPSDNDKDIGLAF